MQLHSKAGSRAQRQNESAPLAVVPGVSHHEAHVGDAIAAAQQLLHLGAGQDIMKSHDKFQAWQTGVAPLAVVPGVSHHEAHVGDAIAAAQQLLHLGAGQNFLILHLRS